MSDIDWGGKPVPVTRLCGWDWVPLDIAQARIAALEAALTAERERADRAEAEIARRHGIGGELIIARRERDEAHNELAALRERVERAVAALECGHPASLMLHSAETGEPLYCELCDMRSQRNDAVQMEEHYKAERDALRERVARLVGAIEKVQDIAGRDIRSLHGYAASLVQIIGVTRTALEGK